MLDTVVSLGIRRSVKSKCEMRAICKGSKYWLNYVKYIVKKFSCLQIKTIPPEQVDEEWQYLEISNKITGWQNW